MSAVPKEQVTFAFQTTSEAENMDWLASDQRREITEHCACKEWAVGQRQGQALLLEDFFSPLCLDFQNHFLVKIRATLFLSYKAFKIFESFFYFIAFLVNDMNCLQTLHFTPPHYCCKLI